MRDRYQEAELVKDIEAQLHPSYMLDAGVHIIPFLIPNGIGVESTFRGSTLYVSL